MVTSAPMNRGLRVGCVAAASVALLWAIGNAVYVYLVLHGGRVFRVESAAFILAATLLPLAVWGPSRASGPATLTARDNTWLIVLAACSWLLALAPFLTLPFLSDDYVFLASYRNLSDAFNVRHFFRPMFAAVFLALRTIGGGSPVPFHLAALAVHAASGWFVYLLARRLFRRDDAAVLCFAVFLLNPLQAEAVLWVSGLQETLWTAFVLAGLVVYTGSPLLSASRAGATLLLIVCALLSKETAISSVLLLPAADWAFFRMRRGPLLPAMYALLVAAGSAYLFIRSRVASPDPAFYVVPDRYFVQKFLSTPYRFFTQPWNAAVVKVPPLVSCCTGVVAFSLLFWAVVRGAGPLVLAGPVSIVLSTLPVYIYFYVSADLRASRYLYFGAIGWALLTAHVLKTVVVRRRWFAASVAVVILLSLTWLQVNLQPWRTAGEIVSAVSRDIESGRPLEASSTALRQKYGEGLEFKDGVPVVYKGVYLFVNGYPELHRMLTTDRDR